MKQYNELTYEEKVNLVRESLEKWKNGDDEYSCFDNWHQVVGWCLGMYYMKSEGFKHPMTPPFEWQDDFYGIAKSLV